LFFFFFFFFWGSSSGNCPGTSFCFRSSLLSVMVNPSKLSALLKDLNLPYSVFGSTSILRLGLTPLGFPTQSAGRSQFAPYSSVCSYPILLIYVPV
jgi:hypothetical protein